MAGWQLMWLDLLFTQRQRLHRSDEASLVVGGQRREVGAEVEQIVPELVRHAETPARDAVLALDEDAAVRRCRVEEAGQPLPVYASGRLEEATLLREERRSRLAGQL